MHWLPGEPLVPPTDIGDARRFGELSAYAKSLEGELKQARESARSAGESVRRAAERADRLVRARLASVEQLERAFAEVKAERDTQIDTILSLHAGYTQTKNRLLELEAERASLQHRNEEQELLAAEAARDKAALIERDQRLSAALVAFIFEAIAAARAESKAIAAAIEAIQSSRIWRLKAALSRLLSGLRIGRRALTK